MSSIHYKFAASANFRTIKFNGLSISLSDLKREIMENEGLKSTESDLTVINAQTSEAYTDHNQQISKNSSVKGIELKLLTLNLKNDPFLL